MKLVVLGRDGVINESLEDGSSVTATNWSTLPGSMEAIAMLTRSGIRVVVATNQQGVREGTLDVEDVHDVHDKMHQMAQEAGGAIDAVFFASTGNPRGHGKQQPKVQLLEQVQARYQVDFPDMVVIGDSREDLDAAAAVGARSVLVQTGHGREVLGELADFDGVTIHSDLAAAVDALLGA
ncbi:MAG: HAD-IIIA family hydrolase [Pseudomonadota bacterium]